MRNARTLRSGLYVAEKVQRTYEDGHTSGGMGSRLAEETDIKPKPMVEVGGRPILWHIMQHYAHFGFTDFVIALGYKGEYIKRYMLDYGLSTTTSPSRSAPATCFATATAARLDRRSGRHRLAHDDRRADQEPAPYFDNEPFMLTWGDGVSNVNLKSYWRSTGARQARDHHRRPTAGPLRAHGSSTATGSRNSRKSRRLLRAGSTARSSCSSPRCSTTSRATIRLRERSHRAAGAGRPVDGLPALRFLAVHGYAPRPKLLESLWDSGTAPWKIWK